MLNICNSGHDEVCYEGSSSVCPVCLLLDETYRLKSDLADANRTMQQLDSTIEDLKGEIRTLEATENVNER